jgi:hypothetical protein
VIVPILNKTSSRVHMELEVDMLSVHGKLVKYVVHSSRRKDDFYKKNSSHKLPKQQSTSFWSQGILGVKKEFSNAFVILKELAPSKVA